MLPILDQQVPGHVPAEGQLRMGQVVRSVPALSARCLVSQTGHERSPTPATPSARRPVSQPGHERSPTPSVHRRGQAGQEGTVLSIRARGLAVEISRQVSRAPAHHPGPDTQDPGAAGGLRGPPGRAVSARIPGRHQIGGCGVVRPRTTRAYQSGGAGFDETSVSPDDARRIR